MLEAVVILVANSAKTHSQSNGKESDKSHPYLKFLEEINLKNSSFMEQSPYSNLGESLMKVIQI